MVPIGDRLETGPQSPDLERLLQESVLGETKITWFPWGDCSLRPVLETRDPVFLLHCLLKPRKSVPRVTKGVDDSPIYKGHDAVSAGPG